MTDMRLTNIITLGLAGTMTALSVSPQNHMPMPAVTSLHVPRVTYTIRAVVIPELLLVRGQIELEYRNFSNDTLSEIYFRLDRKTTPPSDYLRIDSILYRGAPLTKSEITIDNNIMKVSLPKNLAPKASGFFLIAFESKVALQNIDSSRKGHDESHYMAFSNWYPRVCIYRDGQWYDEQHLPCNERVSEYAHYNIALKIDSSYSIAHPGKLLNEKEHYGLLPKSNDIVYVDVAKHHTLTIGGVRYRPEFLSGLKRYYMRARNVTDFPFVVGREYIRDRMYLNNLTIEVCYPENVRGVWAGFVARSSSNLVRQYEKWLGRFPYNNLTIVAGEVPRGNHSSHQFILLPANINDSSLLYTALAVELAKGWFSPVLPGSNGAWRLLDEGLAYYLAVKALYDRFGVAGYEMIREHRMYVTNPVGGKEQAQHPTTRVFHEIPSQIHALRFAVGDKILLNAFQEYIRRFRYEFPGAGDFFDVVQEVRSRSPEVSFSTWTSENNVFDFGVSNTKTKHTESGYEVSYEVKNLGSTVMPVEIGYVISATDTVYDTLQYDQLPAPNATCSAYTTIHRRPQAVILDPNHYLPDINRSNNYSFTLPVRFRYHPPKTLFPPLDNLR